MEEAGTWKLHRGGGVGMRPQFECECESVGCVDVSTHSSNCCLSLLAQLVGAGGGGGGAVCVCVCLSVEKEERGLPGYSAI